MATSAALRPSWGICKVARRRPPNVGQMRRVLQPTAADHAAASRAAESCRPCCLARAAALVATPAVCVAVTLRIRPAVVQTGIGGISSPRRHITGSTHPPRTRPVPCTCRSCHRCSHRCLSIHGQPALAAPTHLVHALADVHEAHGQPLKLDVRHLVPAVAKQQLRSQVW